jgi:phosphinothricin acetyltransferase
MLRRATTADAAALAGIYNHYVAHTIITFEEEPVSAAGMAQRIGETLADGFPWFVWAEPDGRILGYAHASKWKSRCSYRYSAETTVYLDKSATRRGLGTKLYTAVIAELRALKLHALIGGVALPNEASIALHEKFGFRKVAHFKETGFKFGQWIDVGYWELML